MKVFVTFACLFTIVTVALAGCPQDIAPVTRYSTWANKAADASSVVVIPPGTRILFDESPPFVLHKILVQGELIFEDKPLSLDIQYLLVENGGHLWIGSEACPFKSKLTITLFGEKQVPFSDPPLIGANKVLGGFDGSIIDIHGSPKLPTWTTLSATVQKGATRITLSEKVQWGVGDEIVIATTDYSYMDNNNPSTAIIQNERRVITKVVNGNEVHFDEPLKFMHYGKIWTTPLDSSVSIDMRAEVGLLTRNVVIRGDTTQGNTLRDRWGGHIMVESNSLLRMDGAELYHMGQKDNKARYPIHFHMCRSQPGSYAKRNAIHDTFQRAITVHGTSNLTIAENVAFNVSGLMYFIEDGNEEHNMFRKNLGIQAMPHTLLTEADKEPSVFWITNPLNYFEDNVAVGSNFGFWFAMPKQPTGLGPSLPSFPTTYPRVTKLGSFKNNKAHSMTQDGLHIDSMDVDGTGKLEMASWESYDWSHIPLDEQLILSQDTNVDRRYYANRLHYLIKTTGARAFVTLENFISYKNTGFGIWGRGEQLVVANAKLADNHIGAQFPGGHNLMRDSIIVGETDNIGNPEAFDANAYQGRSRPYRWDAARPLIGYRHYDSGGPDMTLNLKFYNFYPLRFFFNGKERIASAFAVQGGNHVISPRNKHYNAKFFNTPIRVWYDDYEWNGPASVAKRGAVVIDADGSLTGKCGSSIAIYYPLMYDDTCTRYEQWNAYVCPPGGHPHRYFRVEDITPDGYGGTGTAFDDPDPEVRGNRTALFIHRLFDHASQYIQATGKGSVPNPPKRDQLTINLMTNYAYLLQFGIYSETPSLVTLQLNYGQRGEWIKVAIPYPSGTTFTFQNSNMADAALWVRVNSVAEVGSAPATYFYDEATKLLWLTMQFREESYLLAFGKKWYDSYIRVTINATCPNNDCTQHVNPASITHPRTPPPPESICESGGGVENGDLVYTKKNNNVMNVYTDSLDPAWTMSSWINGAANETSDIGADGSQKSIQMDFNNWWSVTFRRKDDKTVISPSDYTHLEFKVRLAPGRGVLRTGIFLIAQDKARKDINPVKWKSVDIESPFYTNDAPIDDKHWATIRIPITDLGYQDDGDIFSFRLSSSENPRPTLTYIDEIKFVNLNSVINPVEPAVDAPEISNEPIKFMDPLGALVSVDVESPDTSVIDNNNQNKAPAAKETLPTWAVAVMVILAVLVVAALIGIVILFIKMRSGGNSYYP